MGTLTQAEAREFGRALRFIRDARRMPLRAVSLETGISYQYLHNIEAGDRTGFSDELVLGLQRAYRLPDRALDDLLLRARVRSALDQRGSPSLTPTPRGGCWRRGSGNLALRSTPISRGSWRASSGSRRESGSGGATRPRRPGERAVNKFVAVPSPPVQPRRAGAVQQGQERPRVAMFRNFE
jgi:transcriptional regulator with XRE-family HTH domain